MPRGIYQHKSNGGFLTCIECGEKKWVSLSQLGGKYCSMVCRSKHNTVIKRCPTCNRDFKINKSEANGFTHCSMNCRRRPMRQVTCKRCGKAFQTREPHHPYCSERCYRPPIMINCEKCGKRIRKEQWRSDHRFCSISCYRSFQGESGLERKVKDALTELKIPFIQEYPLGRYSIDFVLPKHKIAIEVNGLYWHSSRATLKKDGRKTLYLIKHGWPTCRIWETEINETHSVKRLLLHRLGPMRNWRKVGGLNAVA